jgi:FAD/FMN-containing dehydrogenase/Fe-S oxidoreductase
MMDMVHANNPLSPEFISDIEQSLESKIRQDKATRLLYSTDASIYQIEPLGVAFPRTLDELTAAVRACARHNIPLLPRGAGSSLAGQAIGPALILDCARRLTRIHAIDPEAQTAWVEPGLILSALNRRAAAYGLQFGPDPASADRATVGGSLANNATGAHSILYGMAADHLLAAEVILADGSTAVFEEIGLAEAERKAGRDNLEGEIYRVALDIRVGLGDQIRARWPRTWRNASGYNLNYLLPWSPGQPPQWRAGSDSDRLSNPVNGGYPPVRPGCINLAPLLAGSEGTLAVIGRAKLGLVPRPSQTILGVLGYPSVAAACEAAPDLLHRRPSAIEMIPQGLIRLARSVPAYARQLTFLDQLTTTADRNSPEAILVVEFSGEEPSLLLEQARDLGSDVLIAQTPADQQQVWGVRKMGLGILMSRPQDASCGAFIEDLSVPVERLGEFVRELERIMAANDTQGEFYAHASAGCLHVRPLVHMKDPSGPSRMRTIAEQAVEMVLGLGGSPTGEHGDGLARGEWLERTYGSEIVSAFRRLKQAADPQGILNPGKKVGVQPMDANLRFGAGYSAAGWAPVMDFSRNGGDAGEAGLLGAIEHCNGAGVCRKLDGVMCPSFQVNLEEMHSTRGRANLLRALVSGKFPSFTEGEAAVREALDLCLACKGCRTECPSGVDVAKLKYEFTSRYYERHKRPLRDYLFGYIGILLRLGSPFAWLANAMLDSAWFSRMGERFLGLTPHRPLPAYSRQGWRGAAKQADLWGLPEGEAELVLLLLDSFNEYFHPETVTAALKLLAAAGCKVTVLPVRGAGRTLISKGFLPAAGRHARDVLRTVARYDPDGKMPVVGLEPSEIYTLKDEFLDLLTGPETSAAAQALAGRAYMVDEYLARPGLDGKIRLLRIAEHFKEDLPGQQRPVYLHGHCYQKAQPPAADGYPTGAGATVMMLETLGYRVKLIDAGCCGMAGSFGYEKEHYEFSMQVGESRLFPAVRAVEEDAIIAAVGVSCRPHIEDGAGRRAVHPVVLGVDEYRPE